MTLENENILLNCLVNGGLVGKTFHPESGIDYSIKNHRPYTLAQSNAIMVKVRYQDDSEGEINLLNHLYDQKID